MKDRWDWDREEREFYEDFFDQYPTLSREPVEKVCSADAFIPYEMDASALYRLENGSYAVIVIQGCSCWPDRGGTDVFEAETSSQAIADALKAETLADSVEMLRDKWVGKGRT